jgi:hypothetical protein
MEYTPHDALSGTVAVAIAAALSPVATASLPRIAAEVNGYAIPTTS